MKNVIIQTGDRARPASHNPQAQGPKNRRSSYDRIHLFANVVIKLLLRNGAWPPTAHAQTIGDALAHFPHLVYGKNVLELGTGTGVLAILAARLGADHVDVTELHEALLQIANENARLNGVQFRRLLQEDWLEFQSSEQYDLLIANPPFFDVKQRNRRVFIDETIQQSGRFLRSGGSLLLVHSSMADFSVTQEQLNGQGFMFEVVAEHRGFFREAYFNEPGFMEFCLRGNGFDFIDGHFVETVRAYLCTRRLPQRKQPPTKVSFPPRPALAATQ